jgi:hypothetical protein
MDEHGRRITNEKEPTTAHNCKKFFYRHFSTDRKRINEIPTTDAGPLLRVFVPEHGICSDSLSIEYTRVASAIMSEAKTMKKRSKNDEGTPNRTPRQQRKVEVTSDPEIASLWSHMEVLLPEENDENLKDLIFHRVRSN